MSTPSQKNLKKVLAFTRIARIIQFMGCTLLPCRASGPQGLELKMTKTAETKFFTARARAFSSQGVQEHKFGVYADGTVRVWDDVAGHYTVCHSLGESAIRRLRKLAANA